MYLVNVLTFSFPRLRNARGGSVEVLHRIYRKMGDLSMIDVRFEK